MVITTIRQDKMRNIIISVLLVFLTTICHSQATNSDSLKELNELKVLRQSLADRTIELQTVIYKLQKMKDSINTKLEKTREALAIQKDTAGTRQDSKLLQQDKYLKKMTTQLTKSQNSKKQTENLFKTCQIF